MRELVVVDGRDGSAVLEALRASLAGGPGMLASATGDRSADLPTHVEQRIALVVETSGSTGRPKRVTLSTDALLASAAASDALLGGPGQWLLAVPAHYIAGINVLTRSIAAQSEPVLLGGGAFTADAFAAAAARLDHPRRYTSLVPAQLARILDSDAATTAARRFDRILVGGQSLPAPLRERAAEAGLAITRTYGSSETSGGCLWDGAPIGNVEVAIVDGRIELTGAVLAEGYLGDADATAAAFPERDGRRWFRTDDTGEITDGVLSVTGRVDDVIISGGVKVSLAAIETLVRSLPGLSDSVVVGIPSAQWGHVPVVVSETGMPLPALREHVATQLGRASAPAHLLEVTDLPLTATGKPDRRALATHARATWPVPAEK